MNAKATTSHLQNLIGGVLLLLTLPACSTQSAASRPSAPEASSAAVDVAATGHAPSILRAVQREETTDRALYFHEDIYFKDPQGDAVTLANKLAGTDPEGGVFFQVSDDPITASPQEQKRAALITSTFSCPPDLLDPFSFTMEDRVRDQSGNLSEPVTFTVACAAHPPGNVPYLIGGGIVGLALLLAAWLFFRSHPAERGPTMRAILIFFCMLLPVMFIFSILHEGGHLLSQASQGLANRVVYVHPFSFSGYSRPMWEWNDIWAHAAGAVTAILSSLLISALLWKRRSIPFFPLVALFPIVAMGNGGYIMFVGGDFRNIMNITGLPPVVFNVAGLAIMLVGVLSLLSLLPLLGLPPTDKRILLVLPASYFLWGLLSTIVAYLSVPTSPFAIRWHLTGEILSTANSILWVPLIGLALALFYLTAYRWLWPRLPAWLRTAQVNPGWKDLRIPGLLAAVSVAVGLLAIVV